MRKLEEIAVIHDIDNYEQSLFLECFLRWTGFVCFSYTYNDVYDEFNQYLEKSKNNFDAIFYINDNDGRLESRFGHLTENNVCLQIETSKTDYQNIEILKSIWKKILNTVYLEEKIKKDKENIEIKPIVVNVHAKYKSKSQLGEHISTEKMLSSEVNDNMCKKVYDCLGIFEKLVEVYCKCDLVHEISLQKFSKKERDYTKICRAKSSKEIWEKALKELEEYTADERMGFEHFEYARIYCKRMEDELCGVLSIPKKYSAIKLANLADTLNMRTGYTFHILRSMLAEIYNIYQDFENISIVVQHDYVKNLNVDACKSIGEYELGMLYFKHDKKEQAVVLFERSFLHNKLNCNTIWGFIIDCDRMEKYKEEEMWLINMLQILQLDLEDVRKCDENLCKLPVIELKYAKKCYYLLRKVNRMIGNRTEESRKNEDYLSMMEEKTKNILEKRSNV